MNQVLIKFYRREVKVNKSISCTWHRLLDDNDITIFNLLTIITEALYMSLYRLLPFQGLVMI